MQGHSANQHQVIMPYWLPKVPSWLRKNALCLSQSALSNFAVHVINNINMKKLLRFSLKLAVKLNLPCPLLSLLKPCMWRSCHLAVIQDKYFQNNSFPQIRTAPWLQPRKYTRINLVQSSDRQTFYHLNENEANKCVTLYHNELLSSSLNILVCPTPQTTAVTRCLLL